MPRKKYTPFAVSKDRTECFVRAKDCGIHMLILMLGEVPLHRFEGEVILYVKISDAIAWHEKELQDSNGKSGNQKVIDALKIALGKFERGEWEEQ